MRTKKGFTLMELIIVIAIMGILAAVLVPSWNYFIVRAEIKKQNDYSRIVYNAAQAEATKYKFMERQAMTDYNDTTLTAAERTAIAKEIYIGGGGTGEFYYIWDGSEGYAWDEASNKKDDNASAAKNLAFGKAIGRAFEFQDDTIYKIYIKDYQVMSVCSSRITGDDKIGSYPEKQEKRSSGKTVVSFDMGTITYVDPDMHTTEATT